MKKKLFDRRGAGIELAILMMVVSFSMSILLTSVALIQSTKKVRAEERLQQSIALEQLGQDFLNAVLKGEITEFWKPGKYEGFFVNNMKHECQWVLDETAENTDATCTEVRSKTYKCTVCGETKTEVTPAGHSWDGGKITKEATCKEEGAMTYKCTVEGCFEEKQEVIDKNDEHVWQEIERKEPVLCSENTTPLDGEVNYKCTLCNNTKTEILYAHFWGNGEITTPATCKTTGTMRYQCAVENCSGTREDEILALGHSWDDGKETKKATCTSEGEITYKCTVVGCGKEKIEYIAVDVNNHNWGENNEHLKCQDCGKDRLTGTYTLTAYEVENNILNIRVTTPTTVDSGEEETTEGKVVLEIVLIYDELSETYKITEWTKNDRS